MAHMDLAAKGIQNIKEIYRNLSYEELFQHEMNPALEGYERAVLTNTGAISVDTGKFTGRSPKDKFIVQEAISTDHVWWADGKNGSDNKPMSQVTWQHVRSIAVKQLSGKKLYVMDGFCGPHPDTRLSVRLVTEVAWMAHFVKNMFIRPTSEELENFKPDFTIFNACKAVCDDYESHGLRSQNCAAFNLGEKMSVILGTWYGGEIKKGIFSIMNYYLPLKGIGSFHCSANAGQQGDTELFFGLSGTGKTTLSADEKRFLIGDDEHGWCDEKGIFNLEGGCYAKCINLSKEKEPEIFNAIKRDALLENVVITAEGDIDFKSSQKTENTRVSYPIDHIDKIVKPISAGDHPKKIIFLTCDAFGVLPPVSKLTKQQAMYQFLSGYTAKVAGTELGIKEPQATFSSCFGQAFLLLHPTVYAKILGERMEAHGSQAYLVNTGWMGGSYGVGKRMDIKETRAIIDAISDFSIEQVEFENFPIFNFMVPKSLNGVDSRALNPRNTWQDQRLYDETLKKLAKMFVDNFKTFETTPEAKVLAEQGGPII
jgi:phosphoenolpyruvate carboxykinase (ATP)